VFVWRAGFSWRTALVLLDSADGAQTGTEARATGHARGRGVGRCSILRPRCVLPVSGHLDSCAVAGRE